MLEEFKKAGEEALKALEAVTDKTALEEFRIKYLSRKGAIMRMLSKIGQLPAEQKREGGQLANKIKKDVTAAFEGLKAKLSQPEGQTKPLVDVTLPGECVTVGKNHIITQTITELLEIFGRMGFGIAYGPEVEDEWHNFVALNIPPEHPARDPSMMYCCGARLQRFRFALWNPQSPLFVWLHRGEYIVRIQLMRLICLCSIKSKPLWLMKT
jgi:phenylalanyl-tRNA synthetase alpha chain